MRQRRRGDERGVLDAHAVMDLVALLEAAQNADGVLNAWLIDIYGLETPFERRVFFNMLAIFIECGRADAVQFAARQHWLKHV